MKWTVNNEHRPVCKYQMQHNSDPISFGLFKSFSSCICFVIKITLVYVKFVFLRVHYAHKVCCVFGVHCSVCNVQCLYSVFNFVVIKLCYCKIIMQEQKVVQVLPEPQCREENAISGKRTNWLKFIATHKSEAFCYSVSMSWNVFGKIELNRRKNGSAPVGLPPDLMHELTE